MGSTIVVEKVAMLKRLFLLCFIFCLAQNTVWSIDVNSTIEYNRHLYTLSKSDEYAFLRKADSCIKAWEITKDSALKQKYLKDALRYYYIVVKSDNSNIKAHIGLGRVYDLMGEDRYARMHFNYAYNIDNKNPMLNYRYGDYYYRRKQLNLAQNYYSRAYRYGYSKNIDLNDKLAKTYVKLAEPQKAKQHQKVANAVYNLNYGVKVEPLKPEVKVKNLIVEKKPEKALPTKAKPDRAVKDAQMYKSLEDLDHSRPMYYLFMK
ncbi:MAG: hypothetical protein DKM22_00865 [Candidatus Melainabacteria bacterium]|nr:MAG: hypothetical protein DKM22_00865 [Candidatus Melainabacteria bacterium]